jgi:hypothetical protein
VSKKSGAIQLMTLWMGVWCVLRVIGWGLYGWPFGVFDGLFLIEIASLSVWVTRRGGFLSVSPQ